MRITKFMLLGFATLAVMAVGAANAEPVRIRHSFVVPVSNWTPLLEAKKDLAKHWGKSYVMEPIRFQGTPPMVTALATNELEIAVLSYSTLGLAIQNAGISDLRIIADEFQDGVPGYFANQYWVNKDSGINSIPDLKGKVVAVNAIGAGIDIAMKAALKKNGLGDKRDFTVIEAPFPAMAAMLKEKKADLVATALPFALSPVLKENGKMLFDSTAGVGRSQFAFWVMRKSFIDKNRAALVDFMEDMLRIERWYMDPKNHAEVVKMAGDMLKLPPEQFGWLFTKQDYYRDPDGLPDLAALQQNVDTAAELGFLKSSMKVDTYSDLSITKEAAARLK